MMTMNTNGSKSKTTKNRLQIMDNKYREQAAMPEVESKIFECASEGDAKLKAAEYWGVQPEDIETEVLSESKKLFGLLGSSLRIEARTIAPLSYIRSCYFVNEILEKMDVDLIPELDEDGIVNLVGQDQGVIIGRYGETLKALEYLTNLVCHEDLSTRRIRFDCGGYRDKRVHTLTRLAISLARDAVKKGEVITLEPMSSWERRVVHLALRDNGEVETKSVGEEPVRCVTICPSGMTKRNSRRHRH